MCSRKWARPGRSAGFSAEPTLTSRAAAARSAFGSDIRRARRPFGRVEKVFKNMKIDCLNQLTIF